MEPDAPQTGWMPLAERMRPRTIEEYVGQEHLLGPGRFLRALIDQRALRSLILWGPPGTGKTTLARLYAEACGALFVAVSAVSSGVRQVREVAEGARIRAVREQKPTVLFVDEIHRFSRTQQDALLPFVESGIVTFVGATTENPGFETTNALRSRARVVELHPLQDADLRTLIHRALQDVTHGLGPTAAEVPEDTLDALITTCGGDARIALNTLEIACDLVAAQAEPGQRGVMRPDHVREAMQRRSVLYDRAGDQHFQLTSAFIKSMRGSDPDAALYYMLRMLEAGEDPLFLVRRMVIFASEDIGNADPRALQVALGAQQAFEFVGMPEGALALTQACTYLATAPKSNAVLLAYAAARRDAQQHPMLDVPRHLVQVTHVAMKPAGALRGYKYPHNFEGHYVPQRHLPDRLRGQIYYQPSDQGHERALRERLAHWRNQTPEDT